MSFDQRVILQGNAEKQALKENPTVGFTANGASNFETTKHLGKDPSRMAGPGGAFAYKMMQDKDFAGEIKAWDEMFAESVQGMEFNQAKNQMRAG